MTDQKWGENGGPVALVLHKNIRKENKHHFYTPGLNLNLVETKPELSLNLI